MMDPLQQFCISAHMRCQFLRDQIDLPMIHPAAHLLRKQQVVDHRIKSPDRSFRLLILYLSVVGRRSYIFIVAQLGGESGKRCSSHSGILLILIVIFEQRIAQRILFSAHFKRREPHVRQFCHVIHLVRHVFGLLQGGKYALCLRRKLVRLLPDDICQIPSVGCGPLQRLLKHFITLCTDLRPDKAQTAHQFHDQPVRAVAQILVVRVIIIDRYCQFTIVFGQSCKLIECTKRIQALINRLRRIQFPLIRFLDCIRHLLHTLRITQKIFFLCIDRSKIPCQLLRYILAHHHLHIVSPFRLSEQPAESYHITDV